MRSAAKRLTSDGVFTFQLCPLEAVLAVLVVQQEDESVWWLERSAVVSPPRFGSLVEVLSQ